MRKISAAGIKLIKNFEGCRLKAYKPVSTEKYWTIGWGHYGPDVTEGMTIKQEQADAMLVKDLAKYEAYVNNPSYVPVTDNLNQNQFDALTSFCYNTGPGNLQTLCKGRTIAQIAESIPKYNKAGGNVLKGLVRRRQAELDLFNTKVAKEENTVANERDVNVASSWAKEVWEQMTNAGYFDGKRPGDPITREEVAIVLKRLISSLK
ncbi:lysozyme [Paenibacillus illinoisensis]|uniref:lysozyme n=1 Tax=Paenibacillus illinoisensis TaxID=59845 RepID=UPI00203BDF36|nr:lysozyme [Paenibacillus illinoisensis]MCM3208480.1 lysozyme [Paenibacillus illinoisensis]